MTRLEKLRRRLSEWATATPYPPEGTEIVSISATAQVPTESASKYLQQLCKHWQHNLTVMFNAEHGSVIFPRDARGADWPGDALVTFDAGADALGVRIDASVEGQLEGLKGAVARHLDRFAFREAPLRFEWEAA